MRHAFWHNDKFVFVYSYHFITKFHIKTSFHNIKQFIFMFVLMPGERAFKFYQPNKLAVQFARNPWIPVITEKGQFF